MNTLYYGDNLDILRRYVKDESVDLVYLDPPFKSNQNYNVLFKEQDGAKSASQIRAFDDTWTWDQEDEEIYAQLMQRGDRVSDVMKSFRSFIGACDMLSYLVMMCPRLVELRRVMKPTASIYLHCDDVACHYLKILLDAIFAPENFKSQIIWKRTSAHGNASVSYGDVADVLLYYTKSDSFTFNKQFLAYSEEYLRKFYRYTDENGRRYRLSDLRNPSVRPNLQYEYKGYKPHPNGWACNRERMEKLDAEGRLYLPKDPNGRIQLKRFLDEMPGVALSNVWDDIRPIGAQAAERLGYPTQKPLALLERIISASSNEGDLVLDPFCGCGTAVVAAQKLNRQWIGIDITHIAITLMKERLKDSFGEAAKFSVVGEPVSVPDAEALAKADPYQFQWWALGLVGARPIEQKKGADKGIDGKLVFQGDKPGEFETVIFSVKAGGVTVSQVRDLCHVVDREKAAIGVLISMNDPTGPMQNEAVTTGFYESKTWGKKHPKIQLLTIADLLGGKTVDMPPLRQVQATFKRAPKAGKAGEEQEPLL